MFETKRVNIEMSYIVFDDDTLNIKSFKRFLYEVNYGVLEKDHRINDIAKHIKDDMVNNIKNKKLYNTISLSITPKSKTPKLNSYNIEWTIKVQKTDLPKYIGNDGTIEKKAVNSYEITIHALVDRNDDAETIVNKLLKFTKSEINEYLKHEVKHMLDCIDGIFTHPHYHSADKDSNNQEISKYISQDKEIQSMLVSVLSELEHIKQENPELGFQEVKDKSRAYQRFIKYIHPSKKKKYMTKITHFWYTKYVNKTIPQIQL